MIEDGSAGSAGKIKVLVVDDSAVICNLLTKVISSDSELEVVGTAPDPFIARDKIFRLRPDVLTLDVEMPRMDGISFLGKLMRHYPVPSIIFSSFTPSGCDNALKAIELGAVDVIQKPRADLHSRINEIAIELIDKIKAASKIKMTKPTASRLAGAQQRPATTDDVSISDVATKIFAIGSSTGGPQALRRVLAQMPRNCPGILIVQHMPEYFSTAFAQRLDSLCEIDVAEARGNDTVRPGLALLCPGNYHMILKRSGARYYVDVTKGPLINGCRPSVDLLFESVALTAGGNAVGAVLTGMGVDGAKGLLQMKQAGAKTISQDESSCVVFGMPRAAIKLNAADKIVPIDKVASTALSLFAQ